MSFKKHEENVSAFYSRIVNYDHDHNEGFLTFGIWKKKSGEPIPAPLSYKSMYDELLDGGDIKEGDYVLEVACGQGAGMLRIRSKYGCRIQGIDVSVGNVKLAKRRLLNTGIEVTRGSATNIPFDDNLFDVVICVEGGPHFETREDFFKEAFRVLKPGGRFFNADVAVTRPLSEVSYAVQYLAKLMMYLWVAPNENYSYGIDTYKKKLEKVGFKIRKFEDICDRVFPGYCNHNLTLSVMWEQCKVRGYFVGLFGGPIIDMILKLCYHTTIVQYPVVVAEKPVS